MIGALTSPLGSPSHVSHFPSHVKGVSGYKVCLLTRCVCLAEFLLVPELLPLGSCSPGSGRNLLAAVEGKQPFSFPPHTPTSSSPFPVTQPGFVLGDDHWVMECDSQQTVSRSQGPRLSRVDSMIHGMLTPVERGEGRSFSMCVCC